MKYPPVWTPGSRRRRLRHTLARGCGSAWVRRAAPSPPKGRRRSPASRMRSGRSSPCAAPGSSRPCRRRQQTESRVRGARTAHVGPARLDHDDPGSNRSRIMNVIDSNILERDAGGKPLYTFPHPALAAGDQRAGGQRATAIGPQRSALPLEVLPSAMLRRLKRPTRRCVICRPIRQTSGERIPACV